MVSLSILWLLVLFVCELSLNVRGFDPNFCLHRAVVSLLKDGVGPASFGFVEFCETGEKYGPIFMQLNLRGLSPGLHGMHIHEIGDTRQGCGSAGAHFNPFGNNHGDALDRNRHLGDLGNIKVNSNGEARYQLDDRLLSLSDMYNIMGRTLVVHEKPDDLGRGGNLESLKTGNSGRRVACGVIELQCTNRGIVVLLKNGTGPDNFGHVEFCEAADSKGYRTVYIKFALCGLRPGKHGIHVHETGDTVQGCNSMGAHLNPTGDTHGDRTSKHRHLGDLGNVNIDSKGNANYEIEDRLISLSGKYSILSRGLVLHADQDDLGRGGNAESLRTGNSGARIACGVIGTLNSGAIVSASSAKSTKKG